jgi:manganese/zinc/iron transport system ATP- binding protein
MNAHPLLSYARSRHAEPQAGAPALLVDKVCASYPGLDQEVLCGVSLAVAAGTRVALVGPNGAGKSSLLKAVAGLLRIHEGRVEVFGLPRGACHHRTAYLPQRGEIDWRFPMTVRRLVQTGRYVHLGWLRRPGAEDRRIVDAEMDRLGIGDLANRQIGELSGGQQQRALLARALAQEADLLLLDEPMNAVDVGTRDAMNAVLDALQTRGRAVVIATHEIDALHEHYDDVVYLEQGRRVQTPSPVVVGSRCC